MTLRKINETRTSGPKGHTIRPVNVRAKARTYTTAAFSAACQAPTAPIIRQKAFYTVSIRKQGNEQRKDEMTKK